CAQADASLLRDLLRERRGPDAVALLPGRGLRLLLRRRLGGAPTGAARLLFGVGLPDLLGLRLLRLFLRCRGFSLLGRRGSGLPVRRRGLCRWLAAGPKTR